MALLDLRDMVQKLVARAEFREEFRHDPEGAFASYNLTAQEKAAVLSVGARYGFSTSLPSLHRVASVDWFTGPQA